MRSGRSNNTTKQFWPAQVIIPFPAAGPSTKALEKTASRLKGIQLMPCRTVAEVIVDHVRETPVQVLNAVCLQQQSVVLNVLCLHAGYQHCAGRQFE